MKPAGFDLIENMIIPPSPPGTFRVFAVFWVTAYEGSGIVKIFLNRSAAEKMLAELEAYPDEPEYPEDVMDDDAWAAVEVARKAWRAGHPAGERFCFERDFIVQELEVVG